MVKGATLTLISNGEAFSALEFLYNVHAASNALQRLVEYKTTCTQEHCPSTPLSLETTTRTMRNYRGGFSFKSSTRTPTNKDGTNSRTHACKSEPNGKLFVGKNSPNGLGVRTPTKKIF